MNYQQQRTWEKNLYFWDADFTYRAIVRGANWTEGHEKAVFLLQLKKPTVYNEMRLTTKGMCMISVTIITLSFCPCDSIEHKSGIVNSSSAALMFVC